MLKKKGKDKKQLLKNWILLIIVCVMTILVAVFVRNWYHSYRELVESGVTVMDSSLKEVNDVELYNYLLESPQAFVYVGTSENKNCRTFQKELESSLKEMSKLDYVIYLNIGTETDAFYEEFNTNYMTTEALDSVPAFVVFENGKATEIYKGDNLTIDQVKEVLERSDNRD